MWRTWRTWRTWGLGGVEGENKALGLVVYYLRGRWELAVGKRLNNPKVPKFHIFILGRAYSLPCYILQNRFHIIAS